MNEAVRENRKPVTARARTGGFNAWREHHGWSMAASFRRLASRPLGTALTVAVMGFAMSLPLAFFLLLANVQRIGDSLGKAEGKNWVWEGSNCLQPEERLCLLSLSDGGEDAVTVREFDLGTGQFVAGGFVLPLSKQDATWIDANTLLVARDWGAGTMTASGYPFVIKRLARGQAIDQAVEVFRGAESDQVGAGSFMLTDAQGHKQAMILRGTTFFGHETFALLPQGPVKLPLPERGDVLGMVNGRVLLKTSEDWTTGGTTIPAGALGVMWSANAASGAGSLSSPSSSMNLAPK